MSNDDDLKGFEYKDLGLDALLKAMKTTPKAKVGVLGGKTVRKSESGNVTNAEIGMKHEFGTENLLVRSWLRVPIINNLQDYMAKAGAFKRSVILEIIETRTLVPFVRKMGLVAERIIADGFDSGGFGEWPPSDMRYKKNHQTLVETQQLRNSVTSEVEE